MRCSDLLRVCVSMGTPSGEHRGSPEALEVVPSWQGGISPTVAGTAAERAPRAILVVCARKGAFGRAAAREEPNGERRAVVAADRHSLGDLGAAAFAGDLGSPFRPGRRAGVTAERDGGFRLPGMSWAGVLAHGGEFTSGGSGARIKLVDRGQRDHSEEAQPQSLARADFLHPERSGASQSPRRVSFIKDQLRGLEPDGRRSIPHKFSQALHHPHLTIASFEHPANHLQQLSLRRRGELGPIDGLSCTPRLSHGTRFRRSFRFCHGNDLAPRLPRPSRQSPGRSGPALRGLLHGARVYALGRLERGLVKPRRYGEVLAVGGQFELVALFSREADGDDDRLHVPFGLLRSNHRSRESTSTGPGSPSG